jgi:hypothetical protein
MYDKDKRGLYRINKKRDTSILDKVGDPLIIMGYMGGGTSYITKILRYLGLYTGVDSGIFETRKTHESKTFCSIGEVHFIPRIGSEEESFDMYNNDHVQTVVDRINNNIDHYENLTRELLEYKFNFFWGDAPIDSKWGWKFPHNAILLPIWHRLYPNAKYLVIRRCKSGRDHQSKEGMSFEKTDQRVLDRYFDPELPDINMDVFYLDFELATTDYNYLNNMLRWAGFTPLKDEEEFQEMLKATKFESPEKKKDR